MTKDNTTAFSAFGLDESILTALERKGFSMPSAVQQLAIPLLMAEEGHVIVKARTGTGKTAAFGLPLIHRFREKQDAIRVLVLTPTRELALQLCGELRSYTGASFPRVAAFYGGAAIVPQLRELKRGVEIVVGTPGRIIDLLDRGNLDLSALAWLVLDEADEMLDLGFLEDVEKIMEKCNPERRVALFSATMPPPILRVVRDRLGDIPVVEDKSQEGDTQSVDQYYMILRDEDKLEALKRVVDSSDSFHGLVFCATKAETDHVAKRLIEAGYAAEGLHGDLSQEARERVLYRFRLKRIIILVATDVAARGIDVERLSHVINWDLPRDTDSYVHRIGRTGRAGHRGQAISFVSPRARYRLEALSRAAERALGAPLIRMRPPQVAAVMEAIRNKIASEIALTATSASKELEALVDSLLGSMEPRDALIALASAAYGSKLEPSRYGTIVELKEEIGRVRRNEALIGGALKKGSSVHAPRSRSDRQRIERPRPGYHGSDARVYIGVGRKHGASARDVAGLLMRAGGVAGRLVDGIELRDFCAFATLPADAASRAYAFAKRDPALPAIRPATPEGGQREGRFT